jgi:microsomal dipeptidase-like Zn-dependent dipeptidase
MEEIGMILDLSHLQGDDLAAILKEYKGRKIASHMVCQDLLGPGRSRRANALSEEEIRVCGAELYGVPFLDDLVSKESHMTSKERRTSIADIANHVIRLCNIVGVDRVALGPDYFEPDLLGDYGISKRDCFDVNPVPDIDKPKGMQALYDNLRSEGLTGSELEKIFYINAEKAFSDA